MQTISLKIIFTLFVIGCLGLSGCGSDTYNGDYTTEVSFNDADQDGVMTLDMVRDQCDLVETPDPGGGLAPGLSLDETWTDVFAQVTVAVSDSAPGIRINGYSIEYQPELSEDGTHTMVMPPTLDSLNDLGSYNIYIPPASSYSFTMTCFSTDQKQEYRNLMGWGWFYSEFETDPANPGNDDYLYWWDIAGGTIYSDLYTARYTIRIILYCTDDNGESRNLEVRRTVYFGDYNNC